MKKASQIDEKTNYYSKKYTASKAVDGNTDSDMHHNHCAHPMTWNKNLSAWWKVDLDDTYRIYSVVIYNRKNVPWRLEPFTLSVGNSSKSDQLVPCVNYTGPAKSSGSVVSPCEAVGRYVEFRRSGIKKNKYITGLCEGVVIGHRYMSK